MSPAWGREICGDLAVAESREWLCTNGIGGFASGTVPGVLTRRYHGLLRCKCPTLEDCGDLGPRVPPPSAIAPGERGMGYRRGRRDAPPEVLA